MKSQTNGLSADPGESSTASYWVVNINLNLLRLHIVTIWWVFRVTFLKVQFSKKNIIIFILYKLYNIIFNRMSMKFYIYLQWNRVYILRIGSINTISTSISMFHHKWPTGDLLTLENFLLTTSLLCFNHILISLTSENFDWTELKEVWTINSRTKIGFKRF